MIYSQVPETVGSEEDIAETDNPIVAASDNLPGSNASTLSTGSHHSELDSLTSSLCYEEWGDENDIVRTVLLTSRENINIIHESFRQVPPTNTEVINLLSFCRSVVSTTQKL